MREIKKENKNGAQFVRKIYQTENKIWLIEIQCKHCGKHYTMWQTHYYRGSNPCRCLNEVLNQRLYSIWVNIKTRCTNQNTESYKIYHQDNHVINMCPEWEQSYKVFEKWAFEHGYNDTLTIDRINNEKDYCPENCRFVDIYEQANNKRTNVMFIYNNYRASLKRLCDYFNLNYKTIHDHYCRHNYNYNWLIKFLCKRTNQNIESFEYERDYQLPLLPLTK